MVSIEKVKKYSIEELIEYIYNNKISKDTFINAYDKSSLTIKEAESLLYNIDVSYKRINESLELELKLFYVLVPFGVINIFLHSHNSDIKRFETFKFKRKIRQYYLYSSVGSIAYIIGGILIGIFS
ncbi:hypothetical protein HER15_08980 [Tenacibaculum mesophilum]|uniref:Uncharacterized protein n=1 Tax=Tenacibaculum mesophilum TaxID=104268 RepID=A0AAE9MLN0_9FLAO|nr:hypothetical protein [Tenacibaculum mesophilum]KAF9659082.1 hypothetical protein HBA12_02210 [Tenacibaculum mesophilum]UTD15592.1 hypothetical protein HER15_08980 [Tenacibaculum mesophilum]